MIILSHVLVAACPHRYFQSGRSKGAAQIAGARGEKKLLMRKSNTSDALFSSAGLRLSSTAPLEK